MRKLNLWRDHRLMMISAMLLLVITIAGISAELITPFSYEEQNIEQRLSTPTLKHIMGTDTLGRDLFSRLVYGARVSMTVGIVTALISIIIGTFIGAIAGYFGGWIDMILMRITDVFYIFPPLLLAILLMVLVGQGMLGILLALGLVGWVHQARLVRGQILQVKEQLHVEAARALGSGHLRIVLRHILPLITGPVIVSLTFQIPTNIMAESFLSFIGIGIQPPYSSWGTLASEGFRGMRSYPHLILFPGGVIFVTMLAFQFFGDGLRDILDPKFRRRVQ